MSKIFHLGNLPNLLTLGRIALIPLFVLVYVLPVSPAYSLAALLFALASLTDWLDGYLARKLNQSTAFGAFLDPAADKLMVVTALVMLIGHHSNLYLTIPGLVIIGREVMISALREWMAELNRRGLVKVGIIGRVKTLLQMLAILILVANPPNLDLPWLYIGYILLYIAAIMTLVSMISYLKAAWPSLSDGLRTKD
tara:strand:- start:97 stop:684 length:588 start_codon:yes stop_codon:yes gene_type:complete